MQEQETQQQLDNQPVPDVTPSELDHFFESGGEMPAKDGAAEQQVEQQEEQQELVASSNEEGSESGDDNQQEEETQQEAPSAADAKRFRAMAEEERIRRKENQKALEQLRLENQQLKDTFNRLINEQEKAKQPQAPSFEEDPINALKYENDQLKKHLLGVQEQTQRTRQEIEIGQKQQQFLNNYRHSAEQFKAKNPDFDDAYNFLLESRMAEYETAGYDKEQAEQLALEDETAIAANHMAKGTNPAEAIYKLAKQRGFKGTQASNVQDKLKDNEQKIQTLERGLKMSKSASSGGSNSRESISVEAVANMDDDEFARVDWDKLMKLG